MEFSVIVCTYNGAETVGECVESLLDQTFDGRYEVLVVDDGSTDDTIAVLKEYAADDTLRLVSHDSNRGLAAARNTGWRESDGNIVAYIDDDAVAPEDWLAQMAARYEEGYDGVGGYPATYYDTVYGAYEVARGKYFYGENAEYIDGPGGMNMSFRRELLESIGGFDERFTHMGDDADLGKRLQTLDHDYLVDPDLKVRHKFPLSLAAYCRKNFSRGQGARRLAQKHDQPPFVRYLLLAVVYPLLVPHAIYEGYGIWRYATNRSLLAFIGLTYILRTMNYWGIVYHWVQDAR